MSSPKKGMGGGMSNKVIKEGESYAKKISGLDEKKEKPAEEPNITGEKIQYNPLIHSTKTENKYKSNNRFRKREKQKKEKRKVKEKETAYLHDYNDLLLENLLKKYYSTKSPHLIISRR